MSDVNTSLRSQILIAMPTLNDPNFTKAIILICEHSTHEGAMGIILNQPTSLDINDLLKQSVPESKNELANSISIYSGGPVDTDRGFILHDTKLDDESSLQISQNLFLSSSQEILQTIAEGGGPNNRVIVLGYAGWAPGQLESEISANSWLTINYQHKLVFSTPAEQQWWTAGSLLGIDLNLLASHPGHA